MSACTLDPKLTGAAAPVAPPLARALIVCKVKGDIGCQEDSESGEGVKIGIWGDAMHRCSLFKGKVCK